MADVEEIDSFAIVALSFALAKSALNSFRFRRLLGEVCPETIGQVEGVREKNGIQHINLEVNRCGILFLTNSAGYILYDVGESFFEFFHRSPHRSRDVVQNLGLRLDGVGYFELDDHRESISHSARDQRDIGTEVLAESLLSCSKRLAIVDSEDYFVSQISRYLRDRHLTVKGVRVRVCLMYYKFLHVVTSC